MEETKWRKWPGWADGTEGIHQCISGRFRRPEPRRRVLEYLKGLLSPVERKNGWQLAEQAGDATPYGVQRLLYNYVWDTDMFRDDLREYVVERLRHSGAALVVDQTGFLKKGNKSVGVQRQYRGTRGGSRTVRSGYSYPTPGAGVPKEVPFRTKGQLARVMLERVLESGIPFRWVAGDDAYDSDRNL